jgi:hypothetical protein
MAKEAVKLMGMSESTYMRLRPMRLRPRWEKMLEEGM